MDSKCGGHRSQKGRHNVLLFIFHVNSGDHRIKRPYHFDVGGLSYWATALKSLVAIGLVKLDIEHFDLSRYFMWRYDRGVMWLCDCWALTVNHHPFIFFMLQTSWRRRCKVLCLLHDLSRPRVKVIYAPDDSEPSSLSTILSRFVAVDVEIIAFHFSRDQRIVQRFMLLVAPCYKQPSCGVWCL